MSQPPRKSIKSATAKVCNDMTPSSSCVFTLSVLSDKSTFLRHFEENSSSCLCGRFWHMSTSRLNIPLPVCYPLPYFMCFLYLRKVMILPPATTIVFIFLCMGDPLSCYYFRHLKDIDFPVCLSGQKDKPVHSIYFCRCH